MAGGPAGPTHDTILILNASMSTARLVLGGLKSLLPYRTPYSMESVSVDARYGYSVWLRHLAALSEAGVGGPFRHVVELGPGNSPAIAICALLTGSGTYTGLDVLRHLNHNAAQLLDDLRGLLRARTPIPASDAFANLRPALDRYGFPSGAIRPESLRVDDDALIEAMRADLESLRRGEGGGQCIRFVVPWTASALAAGSVDLVLSQAVLQEIPHDDAPSSLAATIAATSRWLRPGGIGSHQIDLGLYNGDPWNLHWTWSDITWRLVRGRRENYVNRAPLSAYLAEFSRHGLEIVALRIEHQMGAPDAQLSRRFRQLDERDRRARSAHVIVRKWAGASAPSR